MKFRSRLTGTALVLAISAFGLAACGSDDDGDKKADETSQTDDGGDAKTTEGADGKPSKQEVIDGYTKLVGSLAGGQDLPDDIVKKVVTCFVDEVYDDASEGTLEAIATGNQAGIDPDDVKLFTDATSACQQSALK